MFPFCCCCFYFTTDWDSDLSTPLLLVHLLPPSAGRKMAAKISASGAVVVSGNQIHDSNNRYRHQP